MSPSSQLQGWRWDTLCRDESPHTLPPDLSHNGTLMSPPYPHRLLKKGGPAQRKSSAPLPPPLPQTPWCCRVGEGVKNPRGWETRDHGDGQRLDPREAQP